MSIPEGLTPEEKRRHELYKTLHEWAFREKWIGQPFHWECPFCEEQGIAKVSSATGKASFSCSVCGFNHME